MSFQLAAFYASVPPSASSLTDLAPIADPSISVNPQTGRLWSSLPIRIFGTYVGCKFIAYARVYSAYQPPNEVYPLNGDILPLSPPRIVFNESNPLRVGAQEDLVVQAGHSDSGSQDAIGLVLYSVGDLPRPPRGEIVTVAGALSGGSSVARQWSTLPFQSWANTLPPGEWSIIGAVAYSPSGVAFRFVFPGASMRPGGLQITDRSNLSTLSSAVEWGRFTAPVFPRVEVLTNAPESAIFMWLRVIRVP